MGVIIVASIILVSIALIFGIPAYVDIKRQKARYAREAVELDETFRRIAESRTAYWKTVGDRFPTRSLTRS